MVRGGQRRAALGDLRGSRRAADKSPRGFVEASVVGSSHRLRLELSIICGLVFGGRDARGRPSGRECSRRPLSATRGREKTQNQTQHLSKERPGITGSSSRTHRYARPLETAARRSTGYRTQVLRIAPATGPAATHAHQARISSRRIPAREKLPRCPDQHKLTQQTLGRRDPETSRQEQKPQVRGIKCAPAIGLEPITCRLTEGRSCSAIAGA